MSLVPLDDRNVSGTTTIRITSPSPLLSYYYNWIQIYSISQALRSRIATSRELTRSVGRPFLFSNEFFDAKVQYHQEHNGDHCANE